MTVQLHYYGIIPMLAWHMLWSTVCISICLQQAGIVPKWLNAESQKQCHMIAQGLKN